MLSGMHACWGTVTVCCGELGLVEVLSGHVCVRQKVMHYRG